MELNNVYVDETLNTYIAGGLSPSAIQKIANDGTVTWSKNQGTPTGWGYVSWAAVTVGGGVPWTCGWGTVSSVRQGALTKYDTAGAVVMSKTLSTSSQAMSFYNLAYDATNSYMYVSGYATPSANSGLLVKYDTSGNVTWQREFGSSGNSGGTSQSNLYSRTVALNSANTHAYVTYTSDYVASSRRMLLAKIAAAGTITWQRWFYGTNNGSGVGSYGLALDSSENIYVVAVMKPSGATYNLVCIAKYDSSGAIQWQRKYTAVGQNADSDYSTITCDSSGNVYVYFAVSSTSYTTGAAAFILKYNSSGAIQWQRYLKIDGVGTPAGNISVNGDYLTITGIQSFPSWIMRVPTDGSKTGTYTNNSKTYVYGTTSGTDAAGNLSDATGTISIATPTYTNATLTFTSDNTVTPTNYVTNL
jgi:hypothetical protein